MVVIRRRVLLLIVISSLALSACSSGVKEANLQNVSNLVLDFTRAFGSGDSSRVCSLLTKRYLREIENTVGASCKSAVAQARPYYEGEDLQNMANVKIKTLDLGAVEPSADYQECKYVDVIYETSIPRDMHVTRICKDGNQWLIDKTPN